MGKLLKLRKYGARYRFFLEDISKAAHCREAIELSLINVKEYIHKKKVNIYDNHYEKLKSFLINIDISKKI